MGFGSSWRAVSLTKAFLSLTQGVTVTQKSNTGWTVQHLELKTFGHEFETNLSLRKRQSALSCVQSSSHVSFSGLTLPERSVDSQVHCTPFICLKNRRVESALLEFKPLFPGRLDISKLILRLLSQPLWLGSLYSGAVYSELWPTVKLLKVKIQNSSRDGAGFWQDYNWFINKHRTYKI